MNSTYRKPSEAFIAVSWIALLLGMFAYAIGLWNNTSMLFNEKGYYFTIMMYGLFSAISLQKSVRDKIEGIPVSNIYYNLCWFSVTISILLLVVGLWNSTMQLSEKGFYAMSFSLSLFAAIAVQKNTRDIIEATSPNTKHSDDSE